MFRVVHDDSQTWSIVADGGEVVFRGTLRQCEDWLDREENRLRAARPRRGWAAWLKDVWGRLFSGGRSPINSRAGSERPRSSEVASRQ